MLYLNIVISLLLSILLAVSYKGSGSLLKDVNRKEHKLYFLYPLARQLLKKAHLNILISHNSKAAEALTALHVNRRPERERELYWYNRVSLMLLILFLFNLLSLFTALSSGGAKGFLQEGAIGRPQQGEGARNVDLKVTFTKEGEEAVEGNKGVREEENESTPANGIDSARAEENEGTSAKGSEGTQKEESASGQLEGRENKKIHGSGNQEFYQEEIRITVEERKYTDAELTVEMDKGIDLLKSEVLGENKDFKTIQEDLNFISSIPGTGIAVEWLPEDYGVITSEGYVKNEELVEGRITTSVTAILTCQGTRREHSFSFTILPKEMSEKEIILKKLHQELKEQDSATKQEESLKLPDQMEGYDLHWEEKEQDNGAFLLILGILFAGVFWIYGDRELEKRMKHRKNQMLMDYPEIINKFNLLVNAGMTIRQAWSKITEDYAGSSVVGVKKRYAYEEMLLTAHELKLGMPEGIAYEKFGRRTGILAYMKFGILVSQNLKKGNKGLAELLKREAMEAFEERKDLAKRLGEEAGTKLLGPMMVMFIIVLIIIMIPAFLSFKL